MVLPRGRQLLTFPDPEAMASAERADLEQIIGPLGFFRAKTEALLGYGTLHGDMAAAFAPIGDLYKTQLRAVASCLG